MAGKSNNEERVIIKLPLLKEQNAVQQEFVSVNFKNYVIQRGVEVSIPLEVAEALKNSDKADEAAIRYINAKSLREPE